MPPILRPYQHNLLQRVQAGLAADPAARLMLQLPTGGGKTVIAAALLADWLQGWRQAAWLTHRRELAEQTRNMLTDAGVDAITPVNWKRSEGAPSRPGCAVILMVPTVGLQARRRRVWNRYNQNDLLIIDEAHHAAAPGYQRAMKQWPGSIVGMTATPWRYSEQQGFDHLFDSLICGPQTAELQALDFLCEAQVLIPSPEERIGGGAVARTGDYTEAGIEEANRDRPDVMTARVLAFWQKCAEDRQTIAYAVSVEHARNLAAVFNDAGIPAAVILGDTRREERDRAIAGFRDGYIKVLVNVMVATEGFDLPDASCIIIARPTMSLALYLQMVGRGLRPKPDGGDCIILDLAANALTHGLPEDCRQWSLEPRESETSNGTAPVVVCPECGSVSPAASHHCRVCGYSFGKMCDRCGQWRADKRWEYETHCGNAHQLVCDKCHNDAHFQAHLPPLNALNMYDPEDDMLLTLLKEILESERQSIARTDNPRVDSLIRLIAQRESQIANGNSWNLFEQHIAELPAEERPKDPAQQARMYVRWEDDRWMELNAWKDELAQLGNHPIDKVAIFNSALNKVSDLLRRAARDVDLMPSVFEEAPSTALNGSPPTRLPDEFGNVWVSLPFLQAIMPINMEPASIRFPRGDAEPVHTWEELYTTIIEWLEEAGYLAEDNVPSEIKHFLRGARFKNSIELKNGKFINLGIVAERIVAASLKFVEACGENPAHIYIRLDADLED